MVAVVVEDDSSHNDGKQRPLRKWLFNAAATNWQVESILCSAGVWSINNIPLRPEKHKLAKLEVTVSIQFQGF